MTRRSLKQIFEDTKVHFRELAILTEGTREDILKSFLGLVKTNNGQFKSEKQASFLKAQTDNGSFDITQTISFGTSTASQRKVHWSVQIDDQGVVSIVKRTNSKGDELYWERGNTNTIAATRASQQVKNAEHIRNDMVPIVNSWREYVAEKQAELDRMKAAVDNPQFASIRERMVQVIAKTEQDIIDTQERINRAVAAHNI